MNAQLDLPTEPASFRLAAAREAHDAILSKLNDLNAQMLAVDRNAEASAATSAAQSLRQQRTGLLARMLRLGRVEDSAEVRAVDKQLASAEHVERQAAAIAEARAAALAELQAEADVLNAQLPAARRELAEARFEAAGAEIERTVIPAYLAAANRLRDAYAALAGAGRAHHELARELRDVHGVHTGALGQEHPAQRIGINPVPPGFNLSHGGGFNALTYEVGNAIDSARAEALRRWRA